MKKFKGIIFDLDGTAIINQSDARPSEKLIKAIEKVNDRFFITCATGRDWPLVEHIAKELNLQQHCIISAGTEIIDPITQEIVWSRSIDGEDLVEIAAIVKNYDYHFYFDRQKYESADAVDTAKNVNVIYLMQVGEEYADEIINLIKNSSQVEASKVHSWQEGNYDIHIVNKEATKQKAVQVLCDMNSLDPDDLIGVGDGENDIPLLKSVGYSVAMGNGMPALKEIADEVTGSVEEEGLALVVEKFLSAD